MNITEGEHIVGDIGRGSRKRTKNVTSRQRKKEIRYVLVVGILARLYCNKN